MTATEILEKLQNLFVRKPINFGVALESDVAKPSLEDVANVFGQVVTNNETITNGCIITANGTTGKFKCTLVEVQSDGSLNIPTGGSFKINNVVQTGANGADGSDGLFSTPLAFCTDYPALQTAMIAAGLMLEEVH